jgi:NAD(P) transhydrogenase subunit beta
MTEALRGELANFAYLLAALLFIWGLKSMAQPRTAVRGNLLGAIGMALAILTAIADPHVRGYLWIVAGLAVGTAIGVTLALRVQMTGMPQMVALLNGFGGLASVLVAGADLVIGRPALEARQVGIDVLIAVAASVVVGAVTFFGSLLAYGKLEEFAFLKRPMQYPLQHPLNALLGLVVIGLSAWMVVEGVRGDFAATVALLVALALVASVLGLTLVNPIGGADMPVVISLLNSYSGIAAGMTGFVIANNVLIISGALVGASGIILTQIMCKAMNRSLTNVLFGGFGQVQSRGGTGEAKTAKSETPEGAAQILEQASLVVIVPGYGMAVAQAQHRVKELYDLLTKRGVDVRFAIHPVAGRMPGHMNVLLAESEIPYDKLVEMDNINPDLPQADVVLVIGANDVVNPAARHDRASPIFGMPIIDADKARTCFAIKRSMNPGFAGIENELYFADRTYMLFGDAKAVVGELVKGLSGNGGGH